MITFLSMVFVCDYLNGRIYNFLNIAGLVTAALVAVLEGRGCIPLLQGMGVLAVFLPFNIKGGIGGGDVKCFSVITVLAGLHTAMRLIITAMVIGLFFSLLKRQSRIKLGVFMPAAHIIAELMSGGIG
ncbi:MAG: prepilin peptidase [Lachnospiraceae bacterium]